MGAKQNILFKKMHVLSKKQKQKLIEQKHPKIYIKHANKIFLNQKILRTEKSTFKNILSVFFANFNFDCDSYFFFLFFRLKKLISLKILWNTLIIIITLIMILIST